ncbi:hypothetical protein GGS21DRAFT_516278 [Xylaria nigripes]|nr:hypothetical protein GGS21DRAFT_516278 [Xylaria nigripes]
MKQSNMSPPLPIPSKAAIRALRGIALGTSCAIGVIVEDRRRRISTLKTAVANKQKLRSSRQYHHSCSENPHAQLDDAAGARQNLQWYEAVEIDREKHRDSGTIDQIVSKSSDLEKNELQDSCHGEMDQEAIPILQPSSPQSAPPHPVTFKPHTSQVLENRVPIRLPVFQNRQTTDNSSISQQDPDIALREQHGSILRSIGNALVNIDKKGLDRTISTLLSNIHTISSSPLLGTWLKLSARLSNECQASGRWDDASQILIAIIDLGPIDEDKYLAHNPSSIIEYHLRRPDPNTPCSKESLLSAAKIFFAKFKTNHRERGTGMERVGKKLMLEALALNRFNLAHRVYWRTLGWAHDVEAFVRWAIHIYYERQDYKTLIKIFNLHYSHMAPSAKYFHETLDCVVKSVEAMKGIQATQVLEGFARIRCPEDIQFQGTWISRLLHAHWDRYEDPYQTADLFKKATSIMLMNKVSHADATYRTVVEIAVRSGNEELANLHAKVAISEFPNIANDIVLNLVLFKAKAGDWVGVIETFRQVQRSELAKPASYDDAFIPVLKVWAESHSATETRDFALVFLQELGARFHRYMVTLVANKFGEARDMNGFVAWLQLCSQKGFTLDPGFCNSLLYNCWATWKLSFPELCAVHARLEELNPDYSDEVTRRILSQAAQREGKGYIRTRPRAIAVNKLAYLGRSTNKRDIYEAMNQEVMKGKFASAVMIYKRAMRYGMPFCSHCLRLGVLAALRRRQTGSTSALSMIQDAHAQGHEIGPAMSTLMKNEIDTFQGSPDDLVIHLQNLITRLEESQIAVRPEVLTHMALACSKVGEHWKAIALCNLARNRSGSSQPCFSSQSFKALATAYSQLLDTSGLKALIDSLLESQFSTDKAILLHLKSVGRLVQKMNPSNVKIALLEVLDNGIYQVRKTREQTRTQGKIISQETLRIIGDALDNLEKSKTEQSILHKSTELPARLVAEE